jgi:hypothetical protein
MLSPRFEKYMVCVCIEEFKNLIPLGKPNSTCQKRPLRVQVSMVHFETLKRNWVTQDIGSCTTQQ